MSKAVCLKIGNSMNEKELRRFVASVPRHSRIKVASVVPRLTKALKKWASERGLQIRLIKLKDIPLQLPYKKTLGVDRALNVFAAKRLSQDQSFIVLDFGTATTIEFYHRGLGYLGGWIAPGVDILLKSLHYETAKLPSLKFNSLGRHRRPGLSTRDSMMQASNALISGLLDQVDMTAHRILGKTYKVFLTGGGASKVQALVKRSLGRVSHHPDLILRGLEEL